MEVLTLTHAVHNFTHGPGDTPGCSQRGKDDKQQMKKN